MKTAIITSTPDPASINIKAQLLKLFTWDKSGDYDSHPVYRHDDIFLYTTETDSIHCEDIDKEIDADLFIFATRHSSSSGTPTLSVHSIGNWGEAELGGRPGKLCTSPVRYIRSAYLELLKYKSTVNHKITVEATHHGPYLEKPVMFIEIGSGPAQWKDESSGQIIAKKIMKVLSEEPDDAKAVMILGGGHYNQAANKLMAQKGLAVGHICPKYALENLSPDLIKYALLRHTKKVEMVILDWKGLGQYKEKVKQILEKIDVPTQRYKSLLK